MLKELLRMSRRNRKKQGNHRQGGSGAVAADVAQDRAPAADGLQTIEAAAKARLTEEDLIQVSVLREPQAFHGSVDVEKRVRELHKLLEVQGNRLAAEERYQERRAEQLTNSEGKLREAQEEMEKRSKDLSAQEAQLRASEAAHLKLHEELATREADAEANFARRNREALEALDRELGELREQIIGARKSASEELRDYDQKLQQLKATADLELERRQAGLVRSYEEKERALEAARAKQTEEYERERAELTAEAARVRVQRRALEAEKELLEEDREDLDALIRRRAAYEIEKLEGEKSALTQQLHAARAERDRLDSVLAERDEANRRFGGESPEQVLARLRGLEAERDDLKRKLGERPSAEGAIRLEALAREKELWESDRFQLLAEVEELKTEATRRRIAVTELEALRDEKRTLEASNSLLREAVDQLKEDIDELIRRNEDKPRFPATAEIDAESELQRPAVFADEEIDLKEFAQYVRHTMARNPDTQQELFYTERDVRLFIGGLAMSRLHLLQGISGTGKTSLPLAFAHAVGAGCEVIEVQAGWRDRQDLIGHYNTFENRYHESEFLKALYLAGTPRYRDTPFIVVLDEMNLSHPEQYFADLLSTLERDQASQRLVLMTAPVSPAPKQLVDGGTKLPVPPNVWFVGTANHDETTRDFADKTYDRAHVMELPHKREAFEPVQQDFRHPTGLLALNSAFGAAKRLHKDKAEEVYDFLTVVLRDPLARNFGVGWGNRLERQLYDFVPVVMAAGGSLGEAADHILTTKLLRKIRDKHDNRPESLRELQELIENEWGHLDESSPPVASIDTIVRERYRLGDDGA